MGRTPCLHLPFILLMLWSLAILGGPPADVGAAARTVPAALPLTCSGSPAPAACIYGYVYWDSAPVSGASVRIDSPYGMLNTGTAIGGLSSSPYFQVALSTAPLLISPGASITITAAYNGTSASTTHVVAPGGQQADVYIPASAVFGNGIDGDLTVSSVVDLNPVRAAATGSAGSSVLSISGVTGTGFQAEQLVMIHQSRGAGAGHWELRTIQSVASGQLTLTAPLSNTYTTDVGADRAQVIWVPQYRNVTVQAVGSLSPAAWNGNTGGVSAFLCSGTTTVAGSINLNGNNGDSGHIGALGIGFRGGDGDGADNRPTPAHQGEGTGGAGIISTGANGNAGGGADSYAVGSGGGGGGNGDKGYNGAGAGLGTAGSGGNAVGLADLSIVTFGGGGGGGSQASNFTEGNGGGAGGGIALIVSKTVAVTGSITSNGGNGGSLGAGHDADGGGGAGGSILIRGRSIALGSSLVTAIGGSRTGSQGGAGSVGRIRVEYFDAFSGSTNPSASVQQISSPAVPIPTINIIYPTTGYQAQGDIITFRAQAGFADLSGATISAYVWRSDIDGVLSTQASFTRPATSLAPGKHNIFFKVKDSNNNWSDEVSHPLVIVPSYLYLPFIQK